MAETTKISGAFDGPIGRRFMERLFAVPRLAHHPDCGCYEAHVLRFGKLVLCLGCFCMAAGAIAAILTLCLLHSAWWPPSGWRTSICLLVAGVVLYTPTLLQPFWQRKLLKITFRSLLGAAVVLLFVGGILTLPLDVGGLIARAIFLTIFKIVSRETLRHRARFTPDPCKACNGRVYPFCNDNKPRLAAILESLRQEAGQEDFPVIAFAAALAAETGSPDEVDIEILSFRTGMQSKRGRCHEK